MKWKKLVSLIIIVIMITTGVCGCMSERKKSPEEMMNLALEYLNRHYDDSFTPLSYSGSDWAYSWSSVMFRSERYGETVEVKIYEDYSMTDDYFTLYMRSDAEAFFASLFAKYDKKAVVKVSITSSRLPENLDHNATFDEYVSTKKCAVGAYFLLSEEITEQEIHAILTDISTKKIKGIFRFIVTEDAEDYAQYGIDKITNGALTDIVDEHRYVINNGFEIVK